MSAAIDNEDLEELSISMPAQRRGAGGASVTKTQDAALATPAAALGTAVQESKSKDSRRISGWDSTR
ncbi:hypothetical protein P3342_002563 [Pyrenophora teres f. teres]|nr:hypothetical protein P3342_002563 [Pyrenophora teres f. teres]